MDVSNFPGKRNCARVAYIHRWSTLRWAMFSLVSAYRLQKWKSIYSGQHSGHLFKEHYTTFLNRHNWQTYCGFLWMAITENAVAADCKNGNSIARPSLQCNVFPGPGQLNTTACHRHTTAPTLSLSNSPPTFYTLHIVWIKWCQPSDRVIGSSEMSTKIQIANISPNRTVDHK